MRRKKLNNNEMLFFIILVNILKVVIFRVGEELGKTVYVYIIYVSVICYNFSGKYFSNIY